MASEDNDELYESAKSNTSDVLNDHSFDELRELPQGVQMQIDITALD